MTSPTCQQCGQPITGNSPGDGLCASCVWIMLHGTAHAPTVASPAMGMPVIPGHEIVEELARGGMGIVYRAQQKEPHREVALKMLLPFDSERQDVRERFQVEINALAELDHPGILPLYQVGATSGRPWFTMKLAAGGSLATRLKRKRKPSDPAGAAKLMAAMADAVQHAHAHGVLHRDIKPGNILFDESGGAYLADFGLAKLLDSTADMTRSASVLGTPCYMAPEVAEKGAKCATTASDVYGLGAVFYELLTGRPPFIVEGMAALVKKVIEEMPERPSTVAAHVPRDLELVCLACLAKDPRQRYASAADVAADLRRWMNGEPVAARRAGTAVRLWAWARRRPALAGVSAALAMTLLTSGVWLAVTSSDLRRSLAAEKEARERADAQSEFLIGEFADGLMKIGRIELIKTACAKAADNDKPENDAGYKRRARNLLRWAAALWAEGNGGAASPKLREAIELMDPVVVREPKDAEAFALALEARCRLAEVLADTTSFDEAMGHLATAETALARPGVLPLDDALHLQAGLDITRALIWNRLKQGETGAPDAAARAVTSFSAWQARQPTDRSRIVTLAAALRQEGKAWYNHGGQNPDAPDLETALPIFQKAAGLMRVLTDRTPGEDFELAYCAGWVGDCLLRMPGQGPAAAAPLHEEEFNIVSALAAQDPLNGYWQYKLANSHQSLAELNKASNKPDAESFHRKKRHEILERLHKRAPTVRGWSLGFATCLLSQGRHLLLDGREKAAANPPVAVEKKARAKELFDKSLAIVEPVLLAQPASFTEQEGWYNFIAGVGKAWLSVGDLAEATAAYQRAIALVTREEATGRAVEWWKWTLAGLHRRMAEVHVASRDSNAALVANNAALELRTALLKSRTVRALNDPAAVANGFQEKGKLLLALGSYDQALQTAERSVDLFAETRPDAGSPSTWAAPVKRTIEACIAAGEPFATSARTLASKAASVFYPPGRRASLTEKEQKLLAEFVESGSLTK